MWEDIFIVFCPNRTKSTYLDFFYPVDKPPFDTILDIQGPKKILEANLLKHLEAVSLGPLKEIP